MIVLVKKLPSHFCFTHPKQISFLENSVFICIDLWPRWVFIAVQTSLQQQAGAITAAPGLLTAVVSLVAEHGLSDPQASGVVTQELSSFNSWALEDRLRSWDTRA